MIKRNDLKRLIAHSAIMHQKTLIVVIKRHNKNLKPPVWLWLQNGYIPDKWLEVLNEINDIKRLNLDDCTVTIPLAKQFARARFNEFIESKGMKKSDIAKALGMVGNCGQGVQRWKKTGVGKNSVVKFAEVFGKTPAYWRPDLGSLRFKA